MSVPDEVWDRIQKHQASIELPSVLEFNLQVPSGETGTTCYRRMFALTAVDPISQMPTVDYVPWVKLPPALTQEVLDELSPGVRDLVVFLNNHGFNTTDSGDGSNYQEGMECAWPIPMVAIRVADKNGLIFEVERLMSLLAARGFTFPPATGNETDPYIDCSYSPLTGIAMILLTNILSKDLGL